MPFDEIEMIIKIAWESQRPEIPCTLEGMILHDVHIIEGGKTYWIVKSLVAGSVRRQDKLDAVEKLSSYCKPTANPESNQSID